jgi:hypothetical protein
MKLALAILAGISLAAVAQSPYSNPYGSPKKSPYARPAAPAVQRHRFVTNQLYYIDRSVLWRDYNLEVREIATNGLIAV